MVDEIAALLANNTSLPILFVGSGLSIRYLELPSWAGLLRQFCVNPAHTYDYYYDKAYREIGNDQSRLFPRIADFIEDDFNEIWFSSPDYAASRELHKDEASRGISPFKLCVGDFFKDKVDFKAQYIDEIELFKRIGNKNIGSIITTNYDLLLETCFSDGSFVSYIGQKELLFSTVYEIAEMYKIHGCCTKPETIVINSKDYQNFADKSVYLSAKILTLFLERTIIFLGYSITDKNIRTILQDISDCLETDQLEQLSNRLVFVQWNNDHSQTDGISDHTFSFDNGKAIVMKKLLLNDFSHLYNAILKNVVRYDIKTLRRIKNQLYELVEANKPTDQLLVATNIEDPDKKVEFVVGVGVFAKFGRVGYRGIARNELYSFVLGKNDLQYDSEMLLKETIPFLHNGRSILPVSGLISQCNDASFLDAKAILSLKNSWQDFLVTTEKTRLRERGFEEVPSIFVFYREHGLSKTLSVISLLNPLTIDIDDFEKFLTTAFDENPSLLRNSNYHKCGSQFKKRISMWDWLKHHEAATQRIAQITARAT